MQSSWFSFGLKAVGISVAAVATVATAPLWSAIYVSILGRIVNRKVLGESGTIKTLDGEEINRNLTSFEEDLKVSGSLPWFFFLFPYGGLYSIWFSFRSTFNFVGHIFKKGFA